MEEVRIVDLTGKEVFSQTLQEGQNQLEISLASGIYLLQFKKGNAIKTEKLIVE